MARTQPLDPAIIAFARQLRASATDAEQLLWSLVRNRRLGGFKFRRQHPLGMYVLDFYCVASRLAIELDGGHHWSEREREHDEQRSRYLRSRGIEVARFTNAEVLRETEGVLEAIYARLVRRARPSP